MADVSADHRLPFPRVPIQGPSSMAGQAIMLPRSPLLTMASACDVADVALRRNTLAHHEDVMMRDIALPRSNSQTEVTVVGKHLLRTTGWPGANAWTTKMGLKRFHFQGI